ncbi:MAG: hypothetical protein JO163_18115 [Methylobacteriaceae bacterium]|nr:hypothetical protein [Methylobacteriaceae bacterium]
MVDPDGLIGAARLLLGESNKGAPNQARLRRAVSTAYYALFHSIAQAATDAFVGVKHRRSPRYETIYRGFEHRHMKESCAAVDKPTLGPKASKALGATTVSQDIRDVASAFVTLQERRHWADYSPSGKITRAEAQDLVDLAAFAGGQLPATNAEERRNFLAYLMLAVRG